MTVVHTILTLLSYRTFVGTSVWRGGWVGLSLVPTESAHCYFLSNMPIMRAPWCLGRLQGRIRVILVTMFIVKINCL